MAKWFGGKLSGENCFFALSACRASSQRRCSGKEMAENCWRSCCVQAAHECTNVEIHHSVSRVLNSDQYSFDAYACELVIAVKACRGVTTYLNSFKRRSTPSSSYFLQLHSRSPVRLHLPQEKTSKIPPSCCFILPTECCSEQVDQQQTQLTSLHFM